MAKLKTIADIECTKGPWKIGADWNQKQLGIVGAEDPAENLAHVYVNAYRKRERDPRYLGNLAIMAAGYQMLDALLSLKAAIGNCGASPLEQEAFAKMDAAIEAATERHEYFHHLPERCPSQHWNRGDDRCADCGVHLG